MSRLIFSLILIFIFIQSCVQPRIDRRTPFHTAKINQAKWETILRRTELKNNSLPVKKFIGNIRLFLGTPYKNGGTSITGTDCSGFVMTIYKKTFNIDLPHNTTMMYQQTIPVSLKNLKLGDLLFFENYEGRGISHVAIYLIDNHFVHASLQQGVVISDLDNSYYRMRFRSARRVANLKLN